jgi:hypothetical protein
MRWLLLVLTIAGCARAGKENSIIGGLTDARPSGDADTVPGPDASPIDAPPQQVTLTQTASNGITKNNSFGCVVSSGVTVPNSYYRVFKLADYGVATTLHVMQVEFGIQTATAGGGAGSQPATLHIGTYAGTPGAATLALSMISEVRTMNIRIPDGSATRMTVPIAADIAPTANLIVELAIPDGRPDGNKFFVGTNTDLERAPGYTLGPECGITQPTSMQSIADDGDGRHVALVMTVTGMTDLPN